MNFAHVVPSSLQALLPPSFATTVVRVVAFLAYFSLNAVMLSSLVRAMHIAGTTAAVAIVNALSFVAAAVLGYLLFDEKQVTHVRWCIGAAVMLAGVYLIVSESDTAATTHGVRKDEPDADNDDDTDTDNKANVRRVRGRVTRHC
jgi:drug/metabolite transporter (DMT)-like permease